MALAPEIAVQHKSLIAGAKALIDSPHVTAADVVTANALLGQADEITARKRAGERLAAAERTLDMPVPAAAFETPSAQLRSTYAEEVRLIRALGIGSGGPFGGSPGISSADRAEMNRRFHQPKAAAGTTTGVAGGYAIAPEFLETLLIAMKSQGSMRSVADCFTTVTGAPLTVPTMDDRAQSGRILTTENTTLVASTDVPFGIGSLGAWTFVSDVLPVSLQLMQDSAFDFGALLTKALASRLARAENPYFTTGTGAGQPSGVITGASVGVVAATGSTVSFSPDNVVDLIHSVDPVYRGNAGFMMHDTTLQALRKLKDTTGRYMWQPRETVVPQQVSPGTLSGYPVVINQDMPVMGASAKSVLFGDFSHYKVRTVVDLRVQVLRERFADSFQVGFIASIRSDGKLISLAAPIKYLQNSAT